MEQKIIGLSKGIRRNPASSDDGELAECINLVVRNGEIRNAPVLTDMNVEIPEGYKLVYIHQTTGGKVYVLQDAEDKVAYMNEGDGDVVRGEQDEDKNDSPEIAEAHKKVEECINRIEYEYRFLEYLDRYEEKKPAEGAVREWVNLTSMQKFAKLANDYDDEVLYHSYDSQDVWSKQLYSPSTPTWCICRTNQDRLFISLAYNADDGEELMNTPRKPGYARYKCDSTFEVLIGEKDSAEDDIEISRNLSGRETLLCDDEGNVIYEYFAGGVYKGKKLQDEIAKDRVAINLLWDSYFEYYEIAKNHTYEEDVKEEAPITLCKGVMRSVEHIGNVLVVTTDEGMTYNLYSDGKYTILGSHIPELTLRFKLDRSTEVKSGNKWYLNSAADTDLNYRGKGVYNGVMVENKNGVFNMVLSGSRGGSEHNVDEAVGKQTDIRAAIDAAMNEVIGTATEQNMFTQPFLVRYALRLYDGTNTMASAPMLLMPSTGLNPMPYWDTFVTDSTGVLRGRFVSKVNISVNTATLQIKRYVEDEIKELDKWKDIVKGVDIFISAPIYRYLESGTYQRIYENTKDWDGDKLLPIAVYGNAVDVGKFFSEDMLKTKRMMAIKGNSGSPRPYTEDWGATILVPVSHKSQNEVEEEIKRCSVFYHIKYYPLDEIPKEFSEVKMEFGALKSLTGRRILEDDYQSHDTLLPKHTYAYNKRLIIGNVRRKLFEGFNPHSVFGFEQYTGTPIVVYCVVYVRKDGKITKVTSGKSFVGSDFLNDMPKMFYYPDPDATVLELHAGSDVRYYSMKSHSTLYGAYYFTGIDYTLNTDSDAETPENAEEKNVLMMKNRILTSKVNNPFVFDITEANDVGSGEILRIKSNVTALSQGQFGQHPIYAFCSDGVWALPVTEEGKLMPAQPLPREILLENADVCQMDATLAFPTVGGLKIISGSNIESVSKNLEGMTENVSAYTSVSERWSNIQDESLPFNILLEDCTMVHDAANSMLRVFSRKLEGVHYVIDLGSGEWGKAEGGMPDSVVAGYPYWVIQRGNKLYRYEGYNDSETKRQGVLVTREIAFDNPLALKMLHWVRLMSKKHEGTAKVAVYVSNDRENWIMLKSLRKRSWKWYRFAVFTDMTDMDAIEGIVCGTEERWTNRPR